MIGLIVFILGIVVLFKGSFHLFGRTIPTPQARVIGIILMAPLLIEFCASTLLMYNYIQFNADGTFSLDANAFQAITDQLGMIELITVILAIGLVAINIFNIPQGEPGTVEMPKQRTYTFEKEKDKPKHFPAIMTVSEAADYMRISEDQVLNLINEGKLGAARIGDSYRIARIAIEDFMGGEA